ncbi:UNVERIFIED_CONTAM: hypothetical protein Sangu_0649500 [Sesamum angustifolium]|uniref:Uncharacterized protein n=1 Tax=Sesamum angustifolium TaxID=2727405 RepID=A0AAW2QCE3_9LAMI
MASVFARKSVYALRARQLISLIAKLSHIHVPPKFVAFNIIAVADPALQGPARIWTINTERTFATKQSFSTDKGLKNGARIWFPLYPSPRYFVLVGTEPAYGQRNTAFANWPRP